MSNISCTTPKTIGRIFNFSFVEMIRDENDVIVICWWWLFGFSLNWRTMRRYLCYQKYFREFVPFFLPNPMDVFLTFSYYTRNTNSIRFDCCIWICRIFLLFWSLLVQKMRNFQAFHSYTVANFLRFQDTYRLYVEIFVLQTKKVL